MNRAFDTAMIYKMVWFKFFLVGVIAGGTTFLAQTETWSGRTWADTDYFVIARVFVYSFVACCTAWYGFIDKSLPDANQRNKDRGDTQQWLKKDTGP